MYAIYEKPVILVIDSDPLVMTALAAMLYRAGYQCFCASDEEAALKGAEQQSLDLLLVDLDFGRGGGFELCRKLRQIENSQEVPLLALAGISSKHSPEQILAAGANYVLSKPYDPALLLDLVDRALWMPHLVGQQVAAHRPAETGKSEAGKIEVDAR